jgi:hypothetical protein
MFKNLRKLEKKIIIKRNGDETRNIRLEAPR